MTDVEMDRYYETGHMVDQQLRAPYQVATRLLSAVASFYVCRGRREVTTAPLALLLPKATMGEVQDLPMRSEEGREVGDKPDRKVTVELE